MWLDGSDIKELDSIKGQPMCQ